MKLEWNSRLDTALPSLFRSGYTTSASALPGFMLN